MRKRHKLNCNSRSGKDVKVVAIADNACDGSNKGLKLDYDKHTLKATESSIPNKSEKLELKCFPTLEAAVKKEGSKKVQNKDCQNVAISTNEHARNNLSSGDTITTALGPKKDVTKEKIQKIKNGTKQKTSKLSNTQSTFKLKDDKEANSKKKVCIGKSTTRNSVEEEVHHSTLSRLDFSKVKNVGQSTKENKIDFDQEINEIDLNGDIENKSPESFSLNDFEYDFYKIKPIGSNKISTISNGSIEPENNFKLDFVDTLTRDETEDRINIILAILAAIAQILIILPLIVGIISSLPGIPRVVQPRIPVEENRTSKLKLCKRFTMWLNYFLSIAIGFPIPYFGVVTMKGSLFNLMSPLLDLKYNENITEDFKLPFPKRTPSFQSWIYGGLCHPNIVPYFEKDSVIFLYLDSKSKAVTYDVTNGKHRKILGSVSPNLYNYDMLHVRLGKGSLFSEHVCPHTFLQTVCVLSL